MGKVLHIYRRDSAMHGAIELHLPWVGYLTFTPNHFGRRNWSLTLSHNATPWAATVALGPGLSASEKAAARARRAIFGLGRRSLAWCQALGDAVDMALYVQHEHPTDPPVNERELAERRGEPYEDCG